ncbi:MAG TPA: hypothetical protein VGM90_23190 [Kofleriaceae bacterium]|jgi:hypothetical protein
MLRAVPLAAVVSLGGCSFVFQDHVSIERSHGRGDAAPACDKTRGYAMYDALNVVADVVALTKLATKDYSEMPTARGSGGPAYDRAVEEVLVVDGLIYLASGLYGWKWSSECREMQSDWYAENFPGAPTP